MTHPNSVVDAEDEPPGRPNGAATPTEAGGTEGRGDTPNVEQTMGRDADDELLRRHDLDRRSER
jgi:hypothetical protein